VSTSDKDAPKVGAQYAVSPEGQKLAAEVLADAKAKRAPFVAPKQRGDGLQHVHPSADLSRICVEADADVTDEQHARLRKQGRR
jgi:hypothetical protein